MVFGAMLDKQLDRIGEILFPIADLLVLTTVDNPRSAAVEMLDNIASRYANGVVVRTASSAEAFQVARTRTAAEGMICVTGSLYLIGELRPLVLSMSQAKGGHERSPATI
jgi:dihydrofolate synthase/folylpolyglutamate synthase